MLNNILTMSIMRSSDLFYKQYSREILSVRTDLFSSLEKTSPKIHLAAQKVLKSKLHSSNEQTHLMFELFPWILGDLIGMDKKACKKISVNWLAVYLYVIFLDDSFDLKNEIKAEEFIGASYLGQKGLLNLFKIVSGTRYEKMFSQALLSSANFQLSDVLEQSNICNGEIEKSTSAAGKNSILLACAGAIAAANQKNGKFIVDLTKRLLLAIQFLDDLTDFEEDYHRQNITVLLNEAAKNVGLRNSDISRENLLEQIISTGSLLNVVSRIEECISAALVLINKNIHKKPDRTLSAIFFNELYFEIVNLKILIEKNTGNFNDFDYIEKKSILDKVDDGLSKIYFHC